MNLNKFFDKQKELIKKLIIDPNLSDYKLCARKYLELHVKLGSLADETKCFKYWIEKDIKISKANILDKYIECLHYILIIGIDKGYTDIGEITVKPNDYCLSDQFLGLFIDLNDLVFSPSADHYHTLFEDFISLGVSLGFSEKQIEERFLQQNICKVAL